MKYEIQKCFRFTENFLRMTFPNAWDLSEDEVEAPVEDTEVEQTGGTIR